MQQVEMTDQERSRLEKLHKIEEMGINAYPHDFDGTIETKDLQEKYKDLPAGEETKDQVKVAGRIRANRNSGMFIDLYDMSGKIQVYSVADHLDEDSQKLLPLLDIGDWLGVEGLVRRTKRNELSVAAEKLTILSKALRPLPEKFHGLKDVESRFRDRSVDFIVNEEAREKIIVKSRMMTAIRRYLEKEGFLEIETPMLHPILGGANARPFTTHHNTLDMDLYLRIAPELYLKRLIVGGFEKVFELGRNFRNEGVSVRHNPEFTNIEIYMAKGDYIDMADFEERLIKNVVKELTGKTKLPFKDKELDFESPFRRIRLLDLIKEKTGLDFYEKILTAEDARKAAQSLGLEVKPDTSWGHCIELIFEERLESDLFQPTYIMDFPKETSPLTKEHRDDPRLVERIDLYMNGWEIGPMYTEITDPRDQRARFEAQVEAREQGDEEAQMMDEDFLKALEQGMPPVTGTGIGTDRLAILLTDSDSIREVIAFPTLRPNNDKS